MSAINESYQSNQNHFQAEWPASLDPQFKNLCSKVRKVFWDIISIVLFPIGLLRLTNYLFRVCLFSILIVPGANNISDSLRAAGEEWIEDYGGEKVTLSTPDAKELSGVFFKGQKSDKAIIYTFGNAGQWETCEEVVKILKITGVSILLFNPRELATEADHLTLDAYTAYEYLIQEQKIDPNNILLIGRSMGAAYGVAGAALIQEKYPDKQIKAISMLSFATLSGQIHHMFGGGVKGSVFSWLVTKILGVQMDSKAAWDKLKGSKCVVYSNRDQLILKEASLYQAIKKDNRGDVTKIRLRNDDVEDTTGGYAHNRRFYYDELNSFMEQIQTMLELDSIENLQLSRIYDHCVCAIQKTGESTASQINTLLKLRDYLEESLFFLTPPEEDAPQFSRKKLQIVQ